MTGHAVILRHSQERRDPMPTIAILDDDHILRLMRYAIAGAGEVTQAWAEGFFLPEAMDTAQVRAAGDGLHAADGVTLLPLGTDVRTGGDLDVLIFRRGTIDAALMDAHPKLKLIQRIGERADAIDLAAAKARNIAVSCVPRPSLQLTAEHAVMLMLALGKRLLTADAVLRAGAYDPSRVHPDHGVAYNWPRQAPLAGLYGKTIGIDGMGQVGVMAAHIAQGIGARDDSCS